MSRQALCALVLSVFTGSAAAQGLGDAARKESERRSRAKGTTKVYTGDDLRQGAPETPVEPEAPAAERALPPQTEGASPAPSDARGGQSESQWRTRARGYRADIARWERNIEEADQEATRLAYDGPVTDDGGPNTAYRSAAARAKRGRQALANAREAYANFEEEARRAAVPAGWIR
jgi:hypothetical protein